MKKSLSSNRVSLGVCYYPEHWPESLWADDFRRMREMGLETIRIAEFAWSIFEPEEDQFTFEFFDKVMDLAHENGLKVVLGTPTATPPAWLTSKYPEVLNRTREGVTYQHGQRRHNNYNSSVYQSLSARIASKMAAHYAGHPALLGWQIDNELNCETNVFYSDADHDAFRFWVERKYGTLDALNRAWGTVFWNQSYSDWDQVFLSRPTPSNSPNPHQVLDEKRFISDSAIHFVRLQVDAVRQYDSKHWITTNGLFGHIDNHRLAQEQLDFISYDSYPQFSTFWPDQGERPLLDRRYSHTLSCTRDISHHFCVMEQQSGPGGWINAMAQASPKPGQIRLWTYQSIAHGANLVMYFRWRTATFGTEIYWHGINDYHNRPNRRCQEVSQVGHEVARIHAIAGTSVVSTVAILHDYDNEWDGEFDIWHGPLTKTSDAAWTQALQYRHIPMDRVTLRPATTVDHLAKYECLIYPHAAIMTDATAGLLKQYVERGGKVVFGARTGYKNEQGHCVMRPFPGPVADLCGATVTDFTRKNPLETSGHIIWPDIQHHGEDYQTGEFMELLQADYPDAEVIATYGEDAGYFAGGPAAILHRFGKGQVVFYGGVFNEDTAHAVIETLGIDSPAAGRIEIPRAVELVLRKSVTGEEFAFLLNYSDEVQQISIHGTAQDLITGDSIDADYEMPGYGVLVLRLETGN